MHPTSQGLAIPQTAPPKGHPPTEDAFDALCRAYEGYLQKAETARGELLKHYSPKALHAWRVNLRRLTATLDRVAAGLPGGRPQALLEQLKQFRNATGQARDIDILLDETLPAFTAHGPFESAWLKTLEKQRETLHQQAVEGLRQAPLAAPIADLRAWRESHTAVTDDALRELACSLIGARFQQLHKRADRLNEGRKHLHRVRTTTKKLRYTMELFQSLFPRHASRAWLDQLADLQTHLGDAHDRMTGRALCREWLPEAGAQAQLKAFRRWARHTAHTSTATAEVSLQHLWKLPRYWTD